jgi:TatA/E family protein of Tat protein translocase
MPQVGPAEILVILLVGLLVFGPKRLPEIGRQVGRAMREVKKIQETVKGELDQVLHLHEDDASPPAYSAPEASITVPDATPALPPPVASSPVEPGPAAHAQSRFRTPGGTSPVRPTPNGTSPDRAASNGATSGGSAARNGTARPGARPPSRFRAPGPRPTT